MSDEAADGVRLRLDWRHRDTTLFTVAAVDGNGRPLAARQVRADLVGATGEALALEFPGKSLCYWPPRLHCWWAGRERRLPIFGERSIDRAVREALSDRNFGSWLLRSRSNVEELGRLVDLVDCQGDPAAADVHEFDDVVARGCQCGEFLNELDAEEHDKWCDLREPPSPVQLRSIYDIVALDDQELADDVTTLYLRQRMEWLSWRVGVALGIEVKLADLDHVCLPACIEPIPDVPGVYALQGAGSYVKIGKAQRSIRGRVRELQTGHPEPLRLLAVLSAEPADERTFHRRFAHLRSHGEWFRLTPELAAVIREARGS